ncbi:AT-hook motif nuclear-localized protein 10-like [Salvia splendens]|uniref:AT-hook motif nuclear-localized protein 10-like n=1 Tax=Salvia splendens TaxID=180675 RepID=UPI001C25D869|nr:AT-hook motif nuclear-localized protein 10-like [Salvia splendens]XP_042018493.1 AT-hook motif nuclear-localized protein 10-like [Salvia splendens]
MDPPVEGHDADARPAKKKRGRPRKDGSGSTNSPDPSLSQSTPAAIPLSQTPDILAIQGTILKPHILKVQIGEDIVSKITALTKEESWKDETLCILSATGSVSTVDIGHDRNSVRLNIPKGCYGILSLNGSYSVSESRDCQTEGLMVSVVGSDGSVFSGTVVGTLIAASPVQVIVGGFSKAKGGGGRGRGRGRGRGGGSSSDPAPSDSRAPSARGSGSGGRGRGRGKGRGRGRGVGGGSTSAEGRRSPSSDSPSSAEGSGGGGSSDPPPSDMRTPSAKGSGSGGGVSSSNLPPPDFGAPSNPPSKLGGGGGGTPFH